MKNEMNCEKKPYLPPEGTTFAPAGENILLISEEKQNIEGELVIDI